MNQFYEQELPELTISGYEDMPDQSIEELVKKKDSKRRDIKKDPKLKEKERLWDTILVETGNESSSEDEEGYGQHQI
jgi:hypothetical protein